VTAVRFAVTYPQRESRPSLASGWVRGTFGLSFDQPERTYVPETALTIEPGQVVLFTGPSGSGKSSAMRQVAEQMNATWLDAVPIDPDALVIEQLGDDPAEAMRIAGLVGLAEAHLFVRFPHELSDGQQYRFRLAKAIVLGATVVAADEWCATLDRITAKVVSFNAHKVVARLGLVLLCATTHDDVAEDLAPAHHVKLTGSAAEVGANMGFRGRISFYDEITVERTSRTAWGYFAGWHYRGHTIGFVTCALLMRHGDVPIGFAAISPPALNNGARMRAFGMRHGYPPKVLNRWFSVVSRIVIDPRYRGAGLAGDLMTLAVANAPNRWVEAVMSMGNVNPFARRSGLVDFGAVAGDARAARGNVRTMPGATAPSAAHAAQSRMATMRYYLADRDVVRARLDGWEVPRRG